MAHFEIKNLSFSYPTAKGKESLHDVSLTIHKGVNNLRSLLETVTGITAPLLMRTGIYSLGAAIV